MREAFPETKLNLLPLIPFKQVYNPIEINYLLCWSMQLGWNCISHGLIPIFSAEFSRLLYLKLDYLKFIDKFTKVKNFWC